MVSQIDLINAMVSTFSNIAALTALLENGAQSIIGYVDENPTRNSVSRATYEQAPGSLLIAWSLTSLESATETMLAWVHTIHIYVRAKRGGSALTIMHALANGVPDPGDGPNWRRCPLISGVLPTEIREMARLIDEEGIDYYAVSTATQETGD